ncbi:MAG: hypothetical protein ABW252_05295 [Polyangiales bacterium]
MRPRPVLRVVALASLLGCALEPRDLAAFRDTAEGPAKLRAVLGDERRPTALRAEAALTLLDLDRADVDGRSLLLDAFAALPPASRGVLAPTVEQGLHARLRTADGALPTTRAVRAKDVGVQLLPLLDAPARQRLGTRLMRWMSADVDHRGDAGTFTPEQLAESLGTESAVPTAEGLRPDVSPEALTRLLAVVAAHGDGAARAAAGARLVEIERAYRARPDRAALVVARVLPALGSFADTEAARARLVAIADDPGLPGSERELALTLLAGSATPAELPRLARVALDPDAALGLREQALARIGETGAPEALPSLLALAALRKERSLRQRAAELTIEIGGERSLWPLLRALPGEWNVTYARDELEAYAARVQRLRATSYLTVLLGKRLYGPAWWGRVIAVRWFAQAPDRYDASRRLRQHVDDTQEVLGEGWPEKWTVGREAQSALRVLAAR